MRDAHLFTIGTERLLLCDREERLVQVRRTRGWSRLRGKRNGERPPFELEKSLLRVITVFVLSVRLGYLEHQALQAIDAAEVQEEQTPEVRRSDRERYFLGDLMQRQVEQVARDVDREVLEVEVGDDRERLEWTLHAELVDGLTEWVRGCDTVLWEDAVVDEEAECLSHQSGRRVECRGIEVVQRIERKIDNRRVCGE